MPRACQRSVQQGVWGCSRCASGICSAPCFSYLRWQLCHASSVLVCRWGFCMPTTVSNGKLTEKCIAKLKAWKEGMELKVLRVYIRKTKLMVSGPGLDLLRDSDAFPCAVCRSGVEVNSIECSMCKHLVHKKCSGVR